MSDDDGSTADRHRERHGHDQRRRADGLRSTSPPTRRRLDEPGGTSTFTVTVENDSTEAVTLTSLVDDVYGDLLDPANPDVTNNTCDDAPINLDASDGTAGSGPTSSPARSTESLAATRAHPHRHRHRHRVRRRRIHGRPTPGAPRSRSTTSRRRSTVDKSADPTSPGRAGWHLDVHRHRRERQHRGGHPDQPGDDVYGDLLDPANRTSRTTPAMPINTVTAVGPTSSPARSMERSAATRANHRHRHRHRDRRRWITATTPDRHGHINDVADGHGHQVRQPTSLWRRAAPRVHRHRENTAPRRSP